MDMYCDACGGAVVDGDCACTLDSLSTWGSLVDLLD